MSGVLSAVLPSAVAIIPARGGSQRIPQKNIRPFCGRPIISYSISTALDSQLFNRVIVSTDCERIAQVARQYGAEVPFMRPAELADAITGTDPVVLHALDYLREQLAESPELVCCIYPTAPLLPVATLKQGLACLLAQQADSAFSVARFSYPPLRGLRLDEHGRIRMLWEQYFQTRSQDLEPIYHDAGQFYWARTERYLVNRRFFSQNAVPVILPPQQVQDIDTLEDWAMAEWLYQYAQSAS